MTIFWIAGAKSVDVDLKQQKATVTGYVEPKKVLQAAKSTKKKVELWPYVPYTLVANPYVSQAYDKKAPANLVRAVPAAATVSETTLDDNYTTMFSDENPNACSIMWIYIYIYIIHVRLYLHPRINEIASNCEKIVWNSEQAYLSFGYEVVSIFQFSWGRLIICKSFCWFDFLSWIDAPNFNNKIIYNIWLLFIMITRNHVAWLQIQEKNPISGYCLLDLIWLWDLDSYHLVLQGGYLFLKILNVQMDVSRERTNTNQFFKSKSSRLVTTTND